MRFDQRHRTTVKLGAARHRDVMPTPWQQGDQEVSRLIPTREPLAEVSSVSGVLGISKHAAQCLRPIQSLSAAVVPEAQRLASKAVNCAVEELAMIAQAPHDAPYVLVGYDALRVTMA
jgi:hypothetical protein